MTLVVDTSVALKWAIEEAGSDAAVELIPRSMMAPDLFQAEVANILTKKVRGRAISEEQARLAFEVILSRVSLLTSAPFGPAAFDLSLSLAHSVYDCYFLAAAEAHGAHLVTADAIFATKVRAARRPAMVFMLGEDVPGD